MKEKKGNVKNDARGFWDALPRPFYVLAPMANVTDAAFRRIIAKYGKPDVTWTEFVSADGLCSPGKERLLVDLRYSRAERPIVAQLFTGHPEAMRGAARLVASLGYDGVDINMGCPDRAVEKQGGGAAMIKSPANALAVFEAARQGVRDAYEAGEAKKLIPVSVKTRIGYNKPQIEEWLGMWLSLGADTAESECVLPALTVHLRTRKEMSDVDAHWDMMPAIVALRDRLQAHIPASERTLIIGNGDAKSLPDARAKAETSGCDGVMIGRGIFGTPWLFDRANLLVGKKTPKTKTPSERLSIMLEHAQLFKKEFGDNAMPERLKNFAVMKKHFKAYVSGWDGAKELRVRLMEEPETYADVVKIVKEYIRSQGL